MFPRGEPDATLRYEASPQVRRLGSKGKESVTRGARTDWTCGVRRNKVLSECVEEAVVPGGNMQG